MASSCTTVPDLLLDRLALWCLAMQRGSSEHAHTALDGVATAARMLAHDPHFAQAVAAEGLPPGLTPGEVADCLVGCLQAVERCGSQQPVPAPAPNRGIARSMHADLATGSKPLIGSATVAAVGSGRGRPRLIKPCPR